MYWVAMDLLAARSARTTAAARLPANRTSLGRLIPSQPLLATSDIQLSPEEHERGAILINALLDAIAPFQLVDQPIMCIIGSHTELLRSSFTLRSWWEGALYQT